MKTTFQLIPNNQQRRTHSLLDSQMQYLNTSAPVDTTTVCEAQEVKRLRFPQASLSTISRSKTTKLNQPCLRSIER